MNKQLNGKIFCLSGKLENGKRYWEEIIKENGGEVRSGMSKVINYLIAGPGSRLKSEYAIEHKIPILDEEKLIKMIDGGETMSNAVREVSRFEIMDI